jgi:hypothetical protein
MSNASDLVATAARPGRLGPGAPASNASDPVSTAARPVASVQERR